MLYVYVCNIIGASAYASLDGFSAAIFFAVYEEMKVLSSKTLSGAALGLSAYPSAGFVHMVHIA